MVDTGPLKSPTNTHLSRWHQDLMSRLDIDSPLFDEVAASYGNYIKDGTKPPQELKAKIEAVGEDWWFDPDNPPPFESWEYKPVRRI